MGPAIAGVLLSLTLASCGDDGDGGEDLVAAYGGPGVESFDTGPTPGDTTTDETGSSSTGSSSGGSDTISADSSTSTGDGGTMTDGSSTSTGGGSDSSVG